MPLSMMVSGTSEVWQVCAGSVQSGFGLGLAAEPGQPRSTSDDVLLTRSSA